MKLFGDERDLITVPVAFGPIHDILLFYSKTNRYCFNTVFRPYLRGHVASYFKQENTRGKFWTNAITGAGTRKGDSGKPWRGFDPTAHGRHWAIPSRVTDELGIDEQLSIQAKLELLFTAGFVVLPPDGSDAMPTYKQYFADSPGMPLQDIWAYQPYTQGLLVGMEEGIDEDVRWFVAQGDNERLGYPTQKPEGLLERIIRASSSEGDVVCDPFCGCGTTIAAAQNLKRQWIGIDITHIAITLMKTRLKDAYGDSARFTGHRRTHKCTGCSRAGCIRSVSIPMVGSWTCGSASNGGQERGGQGH